MHRKTWPATLALGLLLLCVPTACSDPASPVEITFHSGSFKIVGDLRFPEKRGPYPVVVFVHGDGPNNRTSGGTYLPIMDAMLRAGYATFAWDKPGTGASTGQLDRSRLTDQRAQIVLDAIAVLKKRPEIDTGRIGLWGISQAGYVMPRVLTRTDDIAFMIAISCPGEPGVNQGIFLLAAQMVCAGYSIEGAKQLAQNIRSFTMAQSYEEYVRYKTPLAAMPSFQALEQFGQRIAVTPEEDWHPADPAREYYGFDPIKVIERTSIPVLAVFGDKDTQADPIQGAHAYREALERAGNPKSRVELIAGVDHNIIPSATGCIAERNRRSRADWRNYPREYLQIIEQWLRQLSRESTPP